MRHSSETGFTLVEMIVALFIFAMIAAAGVALLSFGVRAQASAAARLDEVAALRRMSVLLANDLAQSLPRVARRGDGGVLRAFTGNDGRSDALVMGYVHSGWTNPDSQARPAIQRVDVTLTKGRLERQAYNAPDGASASTTLLLVDNVASIAMRYRDKRGEWRERWDNGDIASLPAAVEMTVVRAKEAPLTLAFVAGPQYP